MSEKIFITFTSSDGLNSQELEWDLLQTSLAKKWFAEMAIAIQNQSKKLEQNFWGFKLEKNDRILLAEKINSAISKINGHFGNKYQIKETAAAHMDQELLNKLHHHFEILVGQSWKLSDYILNSPPDVAQAMRYLNEAIHEYEHIEKAQAKIAAYQEPSRGFQCFLLPYEQKPLSQEDLQLFTFANEPGDLSTNYCQLGKPWYDFFLDRDECIQAENINPLRFYASSFICNFFQITDSQAAQMKKELVEFINQQSQKLQLGISGQDPKNALGAAPYAKPAKNSLLAKWSEKERTDFFLQHLNITRLRIASGALEASQTFS